MHVLDYPRNLFRADHHLIMINLRLIGSCGALKAQQV